MPIADAQRTAAVLPRPRAILFDMDGTLVDTMPAFADLAAGVMARHFGDDLATARAQYLATSGIPFFKQLEVIHSGESRNAAAADEFERGKLAICADAAMNAATRDALTMLRKMNVRIAVSSNAAQSFVDAFVRSERFSFDLALGFGGGLCKGEPHVKAVCTALSVERRDLLLVGDSLMDAEIARNAGVGFVGRLGTFDRASFARAFPLVPVVETLTQLPQLFR